MEFLVVQEPSSRASLTFSMAVPDDVRGGGGVLACLRIAEGAIDNNFEAYHILRLIVQSAVWVIASVFGQSVLRSFKLEAASARSADRFGGSGQAPATPLQRYIRTRSTPWILMATPLMHIRKCLRSAKL